MAASTQTQALSTLLFLYREVLHQDLGNMDAQRVHKPTRLPTVLTRDETLSPPSGAPPTPAPARCIAITWTPAAWPSAARSIEVETSEV